jgi:HlyD family secretion protein
VDQRALVRLSALNQRLTPMIEAKVVYLSADIVADQNLRRTGEQEAVRRDTFIVRVHLDKQDTREKVDNFHPTPGMPVDVLSKQANAYSLHT